jgi:hypothetical protein
LRSSQNARRHGLATRIEDDPEARGGIECLTAMLAEGTDDFERIEQSRMLAERHFNLRRIRAAHFDVFSTISDLENAGLDDFERALREMASIGRYERRAFSKNKRALRESIDASIIASERSNSGSAIWEPLCRWQNEPNFRCLKSLPAQKPSKS